MQRVAVLIVGSLLAGSAVAGGAERTERQHARKEAQQLKLLEKQGTRPEVAREATARYLDRFGHLDTRPVRRVESWGASLPGPAAPQPIPSAPVVTPERPLAVPAAEPAPEPEPESEP